MMILSKRTQKHLTILEKLSLKDYTIRDLTTILKIRDISLIKDIEEINNTYYPIQIQIISENTLHLDIPEGLSFKTVYSITLQNSLEFNILEALFFHENHSYLSLSLQLYVSETTIKRKVQAIRQFFQKNKIDITIATKPLKVIGNEKTITEFYISYFKERYPAEKFPFPSTLLLKTENVAKEILCLYKNLNYGDLRRFQLWLLVNTTREENGHPIGRYLPMKKQELFWDNLESLMSDEKIHQILAHGIPANIIARTFHVFSSLKYAFDFSMIDRLGKLDQKNAQRYEATKKYLREISSSFHIKISEEREKSLLLRIFNRIGLLENSNIPNRIIDNYAEKFVTQNRWIEADKFLQLQTIYLDCFTNKKLQSSYFQYEALYLTVTLWEELFFYLQKAGKKTQVGLVFDSDPAYPIFVQRQLAYYFGEKVESTVMPALSLEEIKSELPKYDYVLTNIPFSYDNDKVICVEKTIELQDFLKIFETIF